MSWLLTALPLLVGGILIALAAFVLRTARDRLHNVFFAALYFFSGVKSLSEGLVPIADGLRREADMFPSSYVWSHIVLLALLFMIPLLLLFLLSFPRPVRFLVTRRRLAFLFFLPSIFLVYPILLKPAGFDFTMLFHGLNVAGVLVTVAGTALILYNRHSTKDPIERKRADYVLIGFLPSFVGTWVVSTLQWLGQPGAYAELSHQIQLVFAPALEILAAAVTAYAILKYQLLGFELKVKTGFKYTAVTVTIFAPIFVLSEWLGENVFEELFGFTEYYWLFAGLAGVTLFKPVEKGGEWLTDRLFPDAARPADEYQDKRAAEIYHAQATYVLRDAKVTEREMASLRNLRKQLGLSDRQARAIEQRVESLLKVDVAQTGRSATPKRPARPARASKATKRPSAKRPMRPART